MRSFLLFVLLIIAGCRANEPQCTADTDCTTPDEFLLQSNCPFDSACIDGECRVVCPFATHDPEISMSYPVPCDRDSGCDCSDRGNRTLECLCHNGGCLSVER
jgi:hypothetical protein